MRKKRASELIIKSLVEPAVIAVREELIKQYNSTELRGSCDLACQKFKERMDEYNKKFDAHVETHIIHGEQRHSPIIKSFKWKMQHTWLYIKFGGIKIYVDPTCGQFRYLYDDVPDYYISIKKPKWFYPDKSNPAWNNGWTRKINEKIRIRYKIKYPNSGVTMINKGIIEFFQYTVWGNISDLISFDKRSTDFTKTK